MNDTGSKSSSDSEAEQDAAPVRQSPPKKRKNAVRGVQHQDPVVLLNDVSRIMDNKSGISLAGQQSNGNMPTVPKQVDPVKETSSALEKLQKKIAEKEEEKERMKKEKLEKKRKEKIEKIKQGQVDKRLSELDKDIKSSLGISAMDVDGALKAFAELDKLPLTQPLLRKEPDILITIKKCTKFTGDEKVKKKAEYLYNKFKNILVVPTLESTAQPTQKEGKKPTEHRKTAVSKDVTDTSATEDGSHQEHKSTEKAGVQSVTEAPQKEV